MGLHRHHFLHWRRLCRPSLIRDGLYQPLAPEVRLQGRRGAPAQLEGRPPRLQEAWRSEAIFRRQFRGHGLHGQPLHRRQAPAPRRRLHPRRESRRQARLCRQRIFPDPERTLSGRAGRDRGSRGFAEAAHALRLLERRAAAIYSSVVSGGLPLLRDGGEDHAKAHPGHREPLESPPDPPDSPDSLPHERASESL